MPEATQMKVVKCRDVGVDCDFEARGETIDDVLQQCGEHARSAHGYADVPPELVDKVKSAIHDESSQTAQM
jgi:predicted small metal-binding protein